MSKRWSCGTILDGFEHVMNDVVAETEDDLMKQIEDRTAHGSNPQ